MEWPQTRGVSEYLICISIIVLLEETASQATSSGFKDLYMGMMQRAKRFDNECYCFAGRIYDEKRAAGFGYYWER